MVPQVVSVGAKLSKTDYRVPFNRPYFTGQEWSHMSESLASGQISGDGAFTKRVEHLLEAELEVKRVLLTTSCTHAMEMAALLLNIGPGDEIIVPSFTFVSTINPFVLRGARPVFVDIRPDTLNLNEDQLRSHVTARTRAIVPVHYAGVGCEMDAIGSIASEFGIPVVEDNAHGLFGCYRDRLLGTFGCLATQSFHETKNFSCGEGGALIISDPQYIDRAEVIREKGTNRTQYFRGEVDRYSWVDIGSSYLLSDLLAAVLYAQLEAKEHIQSRRKRIWETYFSALKDWAAKNQCRLPAVPAHCNHPYHMFYVILPSLEARQGLIEHMKRHGIFTAFHYVPLHLSGMGRRFGGKTRDCPVTETVSDRLLRLPFFNDLEQSEQEYVIESIEKFSV